jgi:alpha-D-ribose 1-methylphosphonate 5-triphosphate diphosphatase
MPLHEAAKLISQNPASAVGLNDRGCIEVGKAADLVLVEMNGNARAHTNTRARVRATLRRGEPIYSDVYMARLGGGLSTPITTQPAAVGSLLDKTLDPQTVSN